jgi:RNA polymerase sigma factor (sigma-70 family)
MRVEEFERLFAEHAEPLLAFLAYRTGDRVLAEDLVADTFEKVLRSRRRFDPRRGSEKTWLYTIALNTLRDHARRRGAEDRALERARRSTVRAPEPDLEAAGTQGDLMAALRRLSDDEREALALRFGADLTVPEIARILSEKRTTVEGRVYRGLRKLREMLE